MVNKAPRGASGFVRWAARTLRTRERNIERWERLIITSFLVTLAVYGARSLHLLEGAETWWLDLLANTDRPRFDAPIAVVAITDADYYDPSLFGGLSPLHPGTLAHLIERVLEHRPRGVVLDIQIHPPAHETADRARARLRLYQMLDSLSSSGSPPIVLVRDLEAERIEAGPDDSVSFGWKNLTSNRRLFWGDPRLERWRGNVRAVPCQSLPGDEGLSSTPTVLGATIKALELKPHRCIPWWVAQEKHPNSLWRIRFTGFFVDDTTGVTTHRTNAGALVSAPPVEGQRSLLSDRIVLIGGTYHAGRDLHPTPVGKMAGVYIWAEALASWIRHDALREPREPIVFALEFLIGVFAGFFLIRFGPALGLLFDLLIVGPLTILSSLLTFGDRILFVSFLPSFVGVYLHYQLELHHEIKLLRGELRRKELPAETVPLTPSEPPPGLPEAHPLSTPPGESSLPPPSRSPSPTPPAKE